jgi:hypothetical protein
LFPPHDLLSACNTVKGVGQDIQKAGTEKIAKASSPEMNNSPSTRVWWHPWTVKTWTRTPSSPNSFSSRSESTGFGQNLFDEWRYLDAGYPGQDPASRKPNPDFVLNQSRYAGASILLARKNFGCGSSREHAPWALDQFGFRASLLPATPTSSSTTASKTACCPLC